MITVVLFNPGHSMILQKVAHSSFSSQENRRPFFALIGDHDKYRLVGNGIFKQDFPFTTWSLSFPLSTPVGTPSQSQRGQSSLQTLPGASCDGTHAAPTRHSRAHSTSSLSNSVWHYKYPYLKISFKKSLERLSFLFFFFFPQLFEGPHSWLFFLSSSRIESFPQPPGSPSTQNGKNKGKCFMGKKAERNRSLFKFFLIKRR